MYQKILKKKIQHDKQGNVPHRSIDPASSSRQRYECYDGIPIVQRKCPQRQRSPTLGHRPRSPEWGHQVVHTVREPIRK